jgi:hypothetical protein
VTSTRGVLRRLRLVWLSGWPIWALLAFACLAAVRLLPAGYTRASAAAPILLMAPGSLTLAAVFGQYRRPQGAAFVCYAALLSVVWSAFASLALYVRHVPITADSTYWCLLIISGVLAIVAEARLLLGGGSGRRAARKGENLDPDLSESEARDREISSPAALGRGSYVVTAVLAGLGLLAGGLYAYDHHPHPAPAGYTWIAWSGTPATGEMAVGSSGSTLGFRIVHHQPDTTTFRLTAAWLGSPSRPLAKPVTFTIGPDRTFTGALFIPPLPDGCTYRIVMDLTAAGQADPLTGKPQTWSINADVRDPSKSAKTCAR